MKTGKLIKELRIKKGMTQEELAEKTELSTRTIQRIENGEVDPRAYTLQMIAQALEVDFSFFTEDDSQYKNHTDKEDINIWLSLLHLSGLFLLFFPTIIIWNQKKDKINDIKTHYRDIIAYQLTNWFIFILPGFFILITIKIPFVLYIGLISSGTFTIINAIRVLHGKPYRYLLSINFWDKKERTKRI